MKKKIRDLIKDLRNEREQLVKKYNNNHNIHVEISMESSTGEIISVNPYSVDLRNGDVFAMNLITGDFDNYKLW